MNSKEGEYMMQRESDKNLMVVTAVEEYGLNHNMSTSDVCRLFKQHDIMTLIRSQYEVLHTQDLSETVAFAEDVLARRKKHEQ